MAILPPEVSFKMAIKEHRMSHVLFHELRNSWEQLPQEQQDKIKIIHSSWVPPRPALDKNGTVIRDNHSGEDFLYMHREMIKFVNQILYTVADANYLKVEGWKELPEPNDSAFPIVPLQGWATVKSIEHFNNVLKPWERKYKSTDYLKTVSLGQLGADLEFTIHNDMHMRWAKPSAIG